MLPARGLAPAEIAGDRKLGSPAPYLLIDLQMEGGSVRVHLEECRVSIRSACWMQTLASTGTAGGFFDGKFQQTGAELWVSSAQHMQVLSAPAAIRRRFR